MDIETTNNKVENPEEPNTEKKDRLTVRVIIVMLVAIIAYAGYEYFWRSLKMSELVNQGSVNVVSTTTPKKAVDGSKIEAEPTVTTSEEGAKKAGEPLKLIEAKNSGLAILKISDKEKIFTIGLVINSDCQSPASGDSVEIARKTASLQGLSLNGKNIPLKEQKILICTYPAGVHEAYVPDPRLNVTSVDQAAKKVWFSLTGTENQGNGRETIWRENFVFDLSSNKITEK